jgi:hypothetical protein
MSAQSPIEISTHLDFAIKLSLLSEARDSEGFVPLHRFLYFLSSPALYITVYHPQGNLLGLATL